MTGIAFEKTEDRAGLDAWMEKIRFLADSMESTVQPFGVGYPDGRIFHCNEAFCELTGYKREELLNNTTWSVDLTPPEWRDREAAALRELRRTGRPQRYEKEYTRKDGTRVPIELLAHQALDPTGNVLFYYSIVTDITERKHAEEEQKKYQTLLANVRDIVYFIHADGRIIDVNEAAVKAYGYSRDELRSMNIADLRLPEERTELPGLLKRCYEDGCLFETTHVRRDGSTFPVEINSRGIILDGQKALIGTGRDISDRRRAEKAIAADLRDTQLLRDLGAGLVSEGDARVLYQQIMDVAVAIIRSDFASMQMLYPERGDGGELRLVAFRGFSPEAAQFWEWVSADSDSTCGIALRTGQRVVAPDVEQCELMAGAEDRVMYLQTGIRAVQTTPLYARSGRLVGMISTHWLRPHQPSEREFRFIDLLARQAADLIERRQAEEALQEKDLLLTEAQRLARIGSWKMDLSTGEAMFSEEMLRILGLPPGLHTYGEFISRIHPEDRERREAEMKAAIDNDRQYASEYRIVLPDGNVRYIHAIGTATRDSRGTPVVFTATIQDITERRQAEEEKERLLRQLADSQKSLESVIENMPAGVMIAAAPTAKIVMANRQCDKILGHPYLACGNIGEYIGYSGYHPDSSRIRPHEWPLVRSATKGEVVTGEEIIYRKSGGSQCCLLCYSSPIRDKAGNVFAAILTFIDITDRKHDEKELADAKAQAELYLDLLGHDINNMNQTALGYLELALVTLETDGKIGPDAKALIEKPLQAIDGGSKLIENVQKLQRLMTEGIKTTPVDLYELFEELKARDFRADGREVSIRFDDVPHYVVEANELLRDVFFNLINNSVKHAGPDRPVIVDVNVGRVEENGRAYYRCTLEDNGPGIPDEMKPRLFHRFQRGRTKAHGKGLGLYLVRTLVEGYHGRVYVEDRVPGDHTQGAKFVVMLPAAK